MLDRKVVPPASKIRKLQLIKVQGNVREENFAESLKVESEGENGRLTSMILTDTQTYYS